MSLIKASVVKISPSMMCADLSQLGAQLQILDEEGVDSFHFDIMDGHFVPNLALSPLIVRGLRPLSRKPFNVHLMVENPTLYLPDLYDIGVNCVTVHVETMGSSAFRILADIKTHGSKVGVALNPATPLNTVEYMLEQVDSVTIMTVDPGFAGQAFIWPMLNKIRALRALREQHGYDFEIEVDGSINAQTFGPVIKAGADVLVVGTSGLFSLDKDLRLAVRKLKAALQKEWAASKEQ
jgi:D-allulose-6-phosphate 3-epimerase